MTIPNEGRDIIWVAVSTVASMLLGWLQKKIKKPDPKIPNSTIPLVNTTASGVVGTLAGGPIGGLLAIGGSVIGNIVHEVYKSRQVADAVTPDSK